MVGGVVGGVVLGWWWRGWRCKREEPACPVWQREANVLWGADLQKRYPDGMHDRRPTPVVEILDASAVPKLRRGTYTAETRLEGPSRRRP